MIVYSSGYTGMTKIRGIIGKKTGNDGQGSPLLAHDLAVYGSSSISDLPIDLFVGNNSHALANFLTAKLGITVGFNDSGEIDVPYTYWINLSRKLRIENPEVCAKAVIMAYLACNGFIQWTPNNQ